MAPSHKPGNQHWKGKNHRHHDQQQQQLSQQELQISSHPVNPFETGIGCDQYGLLEIDRALRRRGDFARACHELALVLRTAYDLLSKSAQAAVFQDVLTAFQQLPQSGGSRQKAAAVVLLRAAQAVLPKQRKMTAVSEFRRTSLANHRTSKREKQSDNKHDDNDSDDSDADILEMSHLPMDVVAHVLDYLDPPSLVAVSAVCRSFCELSASNEELWEAHFTALFGVEAAAEAIERVRRGHKEGGSGEERGGRMLDPGSRGLPVVDRRAQWRRAFERAACRGDRASFLSSNRAYCTTCNRLLWISSPKLRYASASADNRDDALTSKLQTAVHDGHCLVRSRGKEPLQHALYPLSPEEVVLFLKDGCIPMSELLSDSDSDDEHGSAFRLWAPPSIR
ncbi:hypothetical protein CBR_g45678 [Chara braunii]|uniref:F-box domain-containing protein n=1 Tax=Chara braunii TaxID=69332 RepID=A0A388K3I6_CHABU|nr:hypothetical protein CBR_g45678 [Chara braunii]|eukprot:GBG64622.1 hypothetical protein CBR_g45678 [Chara braunii]